MTGGLPVAPRQCDDFGEILLPILSVANLRNY